MNRELFDCAVIGGGLAGLTLAIQLSEKGHSVILFERQSYPFHKVCGEYVSMESYDFLERIGVPLSSMNLPYINEIKVSSPDGNSFIRNLKLGGIGISRYTLDYSLSELARKKGVVLMEDTKVFDIIFEKESFSIKTAKSTYYAKVACGAYGKQSNLDQTLGRKKNKTGKNYIGVKYHVELNLPDNRIELHNFKDGYCGISKVEGNKYCLCYLTDSQNLRDHGNNLKLMEEKVLMKNAYLKKYFTEAVFMCNKPLTISQITFGKKTAVENHVLMLGDTAGSIAPLCGNGMSMAMHASFKAFQAIDSYLTGKINMETMELQYSKQWNDLFSKRIQTGEYLQHLFGKETVTNFSIGILKNMPSLCDKIIASTHGYKF